MSSSYKMLVVGGGLTSAVTTSLLAESLPQDCLTVWDKARGAGGRMTTSRSPGNPKCTVDMGAQYVSTSPDQLLKHQSIYDELLLAGILKPLDTQGIQGFRTGEPGTKHYTAPRGMSSLVKHFFNRSEVNVEFNQRITDICLAGDKVAVLTDQGLKGEFDGIVLTIPVPQILDLGGDIGTLLSGDPSLLNNLKSVEYSTRFAVGFFYDQPVDLAVNWTSTYVSNHPIFRFVSVDNMKRGDLTGPTSVLAHTSIPYGIKNMHIAPEDLKAELTSSLQQLFPSWPQPKYVKCLNWKYSQVSSYYPGAPGSLVVSQKPLLVLAGDGFANTSNVAGCLDSAASAAAAVISQIK